MSGTQPPDCGVRLTSSHCPPLGSHSGKGSGVEYSVLLMMADGTVDADAAPDADAAGDEVRDADADGGAAGELAADDDALAVGVVPPPAWFWFELLPFRSKPR